MAHRRLGIFVLCALMSLLPRSGQAQAWLADDGAWRVAGGNLADTHAAPLVWQIQPGNAANLAQKWVFTTTNDVSATPTVEGTAVYVPDWGGMLYRIDATTGTAVWSRKMSDYPGKSTSLSRNSPAITQRTIIVGDMASATVMAIDKATGALVWSTALEPPSAAFFITASPTVLGDIVYASVSSQEEGLAATKPGYVPSFRGTIAALDLATGKILWTFQTVPPGYTGGAVWSSSMALDPKRGSLYATTGDNYTVPPAVTTCLQAATSGAEQSACLSPDDHIDSIVALDLFTGELKWSRRMIGADTYLNSCVEPSDDLPCPTPRGPDYDFGAGANLYTTTINGQPVDIVGAGQKSGMYWALDPDTGATIWATLVGPGGGAGGIMWGTAADGTRVYAAINDSNATPYKLGPSGTVTWTAGSWAALDAATGRMLWQIPATGKNPLNPALDAGALGALSEAGGVLYAGSMSGDMVAIEAASGKILWQFASGGSVICGPSIALGTVFWGSGYRRFGTGNNKLYAFTAPTLF